MDELDAMQRVALDLLREEYALRYGVAVKVIKEQVGPGIQYANSVARAVVSERGAWFECLKQPLEFSGAAGAGVRHRFITETEAAAAIDRLHAALAAGSPSPLDSFSLLALYGPSGVADSRTVYLCHRTPRSNDRAGRSLAVGAFRTGTLPYLFRARWQFDTPPAGLPFGHGVVFCLSRIGERVLLVEIPYEGADLHDLGAHPVGPVAQ